MWARLLVTVCEIRVISIKLMKRPGSTTHMLHPRGRLLAARYWLWPLSETCSPKTCNSRHNPLFKLWISVAQCSRWKFNFTVSIEALVYQTTLGQANFSMGFEIWWGIVRFIWVWPTHMIIILSKSQRPISWEGPFIWRRLIFWFSTTLLIQGRWWRTFPYQYRGTLWGKNTQLTSQVDRLLIWE